MPGNETFWLNVVNVAFGLGTVAAIVTIVVAMIREVVTRTHAHR